MDDNSNVVTTAEQRKPIMGDHIIRPKASFLDLPPELRRMIYGLVLIDPAAPDRLHQPGCEFASPDCNYADLPFFLNQGWLHTSEGCSGICRYKQKSGFDLRQRDREPASPVKGCRDLCLRRKGLALLRTCRQIYKESSEVFWQNNTIHFYAVQDVRVFIAAAKNCGFTGRLKTRRPRDLIVRAALIRTQPTRVRKQRNLMMKELACCTRLRELTLEVKTFSDDRYVERVLQMPNLQVLRMCELKPFPLNERSRKDGRALLWSSGYQAAWLYSERKIQIPARTKSDRYDAVTCLGDEGTRRRAAKRACFVSYDNGELEDYFGNAVTIQPSYDKVSIYPEILGRAEMGGQVSSSPIDCPRCLSYADIYPDGDIRSLWMLGITRRLRPYYLSHLDWKESFRVP